MAVKASKLVAETDKAGETPKDQAGAPGGHAVAAFYADDVPKGACPCQGPEIVEDPPPTNDCGAE